MKGDAGYPEFEGARASYVGRVTGIVSCYEMVPDRSSARRVGDLACGCTDSGASGQSATRRDRVEGAGRIGGEADRATGVVAPDADVSVTVAVQVEGVLTITDGGAHWMVVLVG